MHHDFSMSTHPIFAYRTLEISDSHDLGFINWQPDQTQLSDPSLTGQGGYRDMSHRRFVEHDNEMSHIFQNDHSKIIAVWNYYVTNEGQHTHVSRALTTHRPDYQVVYFYGRSPHPFHSLNNNPALEIRNDSKLSLHDISLPAHYPHGQSHWEESQHRIVIWGRSLLAWDRIAYLNFYTFWPLNTATTTKIACSLEHCPEVYEVSGSVKQVSTPL